MHWRAVVPAIRQQKLAAAYCVQRFWRGHCGRKLFAIVRNYGELPDKLTEAAILVQCCVRRYLARQDVHRRAQLLGREIAKVHALATSIQRSWRAHKRFTDKLHRAQQVRAARRLQALWRGVQQRSCTVFDDAVRAGRLRALGAAIRQHNVEQHAAVLVQKVWRGHSDREYTRMRHEVFNNAANSIQRAWRGFWLRCNIDAWYDAGPAAALKKLLRLMRVF